MVVGETSRQTQGRQVDHANPYLERILREAVYRGGGADMQKVGRGAEMSQ